MTALHPEALEAARREALNAPSRVTPEQLRLLRSHGCPVGTRAERKTA